MPSLMSKYRTISILYGGEIKEVENYDKGKTRRRNRVLEDVLEGKPISRALRDNGYSQGYSKNPKKIESTMAWQVLVKQYFPDKKLMMVNDGLLKHRDWRARDAGLKWVTKWRGLETPTKNINVTTGTDVDQQRVDDFLAKL